MPKDSGKVFAVIRKIETGSQKVSLRMVGNMASNETLATVVRYLRQKETDLDSQSIHFICNRNVISLHTKMGDLPTN